METPDATAMECCALSIVVPVYRSAQILPQLVEQIHAEMRKEGLADSFELLLVNDASPDNSWHIIRSLAAVHPFIRGISLRRNFGQHNATMAGLNHANGEIVVIMDDDLQHPPEKIRKLIDTIIKSDYEVVYGHYKNKKLSFTIRGI